MKLSFIQYNGLRLLVLLCMGISSLALAQKTKKQTVSNEMPEYKEVFYVLADSPTVKHGDYERTYKGARSVKEQGQYERGERVGVWKYSSVDGVEQEIDFTNKKVLSSKPIVSLGAVEVINPDGTTTQTNDAPIFLGGQGLFFYYFVKYMRYPADARRRGVDGTVLVSARITKDGAIVDEKVENRLGYGLDEEALRIIQLLPDTWLPLGWEKGEISESKIYLKVKYKLN